LEASGGRSMKRKSPNSFATVGSKNHLGKSLDFLDTFLSRKKYQGKRRGSKGLIARAIVEASFF